jgi:hypothetical protein
MIFMFVIAIDTAKQLRYSGALSGNKEEIDEFYKALSKIFAKYNIRPPFHWNKLRKEIRDQARKDITLLVNSSKLKFNVFSHEKPKCVRKRDFYLIEVPNIMSQHFENWVRHLNGSLDVIVDDDYTVSDIHDGTSRFLEKFIKQLCSRIAGTYIDVRKENNKIKATIKHAKGNKIFIYGYKSDINSSKEIQIIDIVIGYVIEKSDDIDETKLFFRKI